MRTHFKSQLDLSMVIRDIIDEYWKMRVDEDEFIKYIVQVEANNKDKLYKNGDYTSIVKQKLGLKRLNLLDKVLNRV